MKENQNLTLENVVHHFFGIF